jgi:hypothetical protein
MENNLENFGAQFSSLGNGDGMIDILYNVQQAELL